MTIVSTLVLIFSAAHFALAGHVVRTDLHIVNDNIAPDGFNRSTTLAGRRSGHGTFPGPLLAANRGDSFEINVINELNDQTMYQDTSIHWHGLFQGRSSWADGAAGVTQCPIVPDHSFLYKFSAPDQAGTYWYHSHYRTQYCDGLRGPLVVYDPLDYLRYQYQVDDESTIITLADWYHETSLGQLFLISNSTLINGLGRYSGGPQSPLAVVRVKKGLRYRFRLIAISCELNFVFSIDGHVMTIIETDGVLTKPTTVDSIHIFVGQRYSFILSANQPEGNYWIRAQPNEGNMGFDGGINSAILRYINAPIEDPTTTQVDSSQPLLETDLHPREDQPVPGAPYPGGADVNLHFEFHVDEKLNKFVINGATYEPPQVPVLLQILSGARRPQEMLPKGDVYALPANAVVELSIKGTDFPELHPFHLHGHNFHVIRSAGSADYNYYNPVIRDVVNTGSDSDNVTIRFVTDNWGPWIFHCHIDFHLNAGLAVVFAEDIPGIETDRPPRSWKELCPIFNSMNPDKR